MKVHCPKASLWCQREVARRSRDGGIDTPQSANADSVPQFTMVVPLRSQARLRLSLPHWGLRTGLRFAGPVFRGCGRPLGVSSPLPFGASTGLLRAVSPTGRALRAPLGASAASRPPMKAVLPCLLGLLRPVSRTARGLRAPHWLRRLFRPHWAYSALLRAQRVLFVRPFGQSLRRGYAAPPPFTQGRLWGSAAYCDSATNQKAPLDSKGSCRR